jgi:hypothetical protein
VFLLGDFYKLAFANFMPKKFPVRYFPLLQALTKIASASCLSMQYLLSFMETVYVFLLWETTVIGSPL